MSIEELLAENARLKAEIERLEHQVNYWRIEAETDHARWLRILEDIERLRKAGDAMAERCLKMQYTEVPWEYGPKWYAWHSKAEASVQAWNAAKEGKPSK